MCTCIFSPFERRRLGEIDESVSDQAPVTHLHAQAVTEEITYSLPKHANQREMRNEHTHPCTHTHTRSKTHTHAQRVPLL